ncbi:MAG: hypothetical protein E4H43_05330 [Bacteroidia bacterium]|nr:MAG: hypothetical protein E4H43_05330 [Bacteroidia bacterium]
MKKYLFIVFFLISVSFTLYGQRDHLVNKCILCTDSTAKYLKDFTIQLGENYPQGEFRFKATLSLRKKTKYRFTMCTADDSKGQLILNLRDRTNKTVLTSYDQNSGSIYPYVDFICKKSGIYHVGFDFTNGQSGSGVSIVSMIQ